MSTEFHNRGDRCRINRSTPMNKTLRLVSIVALGAFAQLASAHDPAEHAKEAAAKNAAPDCAAMNNMDSSKMDMNDPVMKAMMAKCGGMNHDDMQGMDHSKMDMKSMKMPAKPDAHGDH
ncbi:hypothetical protein SAMN04488038_104192 [Solimonas aquatica]|jgi:uncharacterized protein involved in copper resistance|uniref:Pentapeptide MXKDX repeat protein n=1 Tax=Solimonas aquatica TaxID=489703 RepID=A0A1H9DWY7_9GAMM|nr:MULTISPECIES: hypothetical protein [Solimonas]SEQ17852.1 hypothetical protein SAMN04488038_104192 [Solimonas aquatica]